MRCAIPGRRTEGAQPTHPVIPDSFRDLPGLPRELTKRPQSQAQPPLVAFKIPDIRCAIPGRPTEVAQPKPRHPGLVPGPSGRRMGIYAARFLDDEWGEHTFHPRMMDGR